MISGELLVDGPEENRVKAKFEETSNISENSIALSQLGSAGVNLTLNGNSATLHLKAQEFRLLQLKMKV